MAATKEGALVVNSIRSQAGGREALDAFEAAFPGIKVEYSLFSESISWSQKAIQEHQAGIYTWDVTLSAQNALDLLRPVGAITPLKPFLFHPDALDNTKWANGFEGGWFDSEKRWGYGFLQELSFGFWVNTDVVNPAELKSLRDLFDPKWKGKMILADPRVSGFGYGVGTSMRKSLGDASLKQLFVDQQPVISRDTRQIGELLVRGNYPIAMGAPVPVLKEFMAQGLGKNLKEVQFKEACYIRFGLPMFMMNKPPHPNAAKLFANWLLTKEGQTLWAKAVDTNSRRKDVPIFSQERLVPPDMEGCRRIQGEDSLKDDQETIRISTEILK